MIFEVTEPGFPADQAVRIFVQFERVEEATKVGSEPVCILSPFITGGGVEVPSALVTCKLAAT